MSKSTVRRMEGQGLTPVVGPKNTHLFHEEQVQSLIVTRRSETGGPSRVTGDIAADVFQLLDEGLHPVDVVKRLRLEPDFVEALHLTWCRMRGLLVMSGDGVTSLHRMICGDEGEARPGTESDLVAIVQRWVNEESVRQCERCRGEPAAFCRPCARTWGLRAAQNALAAKRSRQI